jgi:hypothetical protein
MTSESERLGSKRMCEDGRQVPRLLKAPEGIAREKPTETEYWME